jgi:hypothetical protein
VPAASSATVMAATAIEAMGGAGAAPVIPRIDIAGPQARTSVKGDANDGPHLRLFNCHL